MVVRRVSILLAAVLLVAAAPATTDDPELGSPEWVQRDVENVAASSGRQVDQQTNPAFHTEMAARTPGTFFGGVSDQLAHPDRPMVSLGQLVPGGRTADPFRVDWAQQGRGLAGHSLGATAVTKVGNRPQPVPDEAFAANDREPFDVDIDAVVAWDNANLGTDQSPRVPTMGQSADYFFTPEPSPTEAPDPEAATGTYRRFVEAGVDAMQVALGSSAHLEWTYIPHLLPASSEGERVAMHYTLAWMDRYVKAGLDGVRGPDRPAAREIATDATYRLTTTTFDGSADASAIGAGTFDPDTLANVPHTLEGEPVADHLSIYHRSAYAFAGHRCDDIRRGC